MNNPSLEFILKLAESDLSDKELSEVAKELNTNGKFFYQALSRLMKQDPDIENIALFTFATKTLYDFIKEIESQEKKGNVDDTKVIHARVKALFLIVQAIKEVEAMK